MKQKNISDQSQKTSLLNPRYNIVLENAGSNINFDIPFLKSRLENEWNLLYLMA